MCAIVFKSLSTLTYNISSKLRILCETWWQHVAQEWVSHGSQKKQKKRKRVTFRRMAVLPDANLIKFFFALINFVLKHWSYINKCECIINKNIQCWVISMIVISKYSQSLNRSHFPSRIPRPSETTVKTELNESAKENIYGSQDETALMNTFLCWIFLINDITINVTIIIYCQDVLLSRSLCHVSTLIVSLTVS